MKKYVILLSLISSIGTVSAQIGGLTGCRGNVVHSAKNLKTMSLLETSNADTLLLEENMDTVSLLDGNDWLIYNVDGGGAQTYFQGNSFVFSAFNGNENSYLGENYQGANGYLIDQWVITPEITAMGKITFSFYARSTGSEWPDRIYVYYSPTGSTNVEDYVLLKDTITLPSSWTQYTQTIDASDTVRFAIRYYETDGGESGSSADFWGLDAVQIFGNEPKPVSVEPDSNATDIALNADIKIKFDQPISLGNKNITISDSSGNLAENIIVTLDQTNDSVVIISHNIFNCNTIYTVAVSDSAILSEAKTLENRAFSLSFSTVTGYPVNFSVINGNGSVTASVNSAPILSGHLIEKGSSIVFTALPDADYLVKEWTVNGSAINSNDINYTLPNLNDTSNVTVEFEHLSSLMDISAKKIKMYPNPVSTYLIIANERGEKITIYNLQGKQVYTGIIKNDSEKVDMSYLSAGLYVVLVRNQKSQIEKK